MQSATCIFAARSVLLVLHACAQEVLLLVSLQDLLVHLRPSLERLTLFEEAAQAVAAIEATEARSAAAGPAGLGAIEEEDSESDSNGENSGSDSDAGGNLNLSFSIIMAACIYLGCTRTCLLKTANHLSKLGHFQHQGTGVVQHLQAV